MREKARMSNQCNVKPARLKFTRTILCTIACLGSAAAEMPSIVSEAVQQNNEALQLVHQGRDSEAEAKYRAALAADCDDLTRAKIAGNLAELYRRQDRYTEAERLYRSALEWRKKNLSPTSIEVAYSLNNLGEIYRVEGRDWEARNLMETAARNLQDFHPDATGYPIVVSNYAIMLGQFQEYDQAEELLRSALLTYQKRQDTAGRAYGVTLVNLGQVLEAKNDLDAAAGLFDQAIGIFENVGGAARAELISALTSRGVLDARQNHPEQARQTEQRALDMLRPGGDALLRVQILRSLGKIAADTGKSADALRCYEQSLALQEKTLGAEHPSNASLLLDYASATQRAGNKSLSRKLRKRAEDLLERLRNQSLSQLTVSLRDLRGDK